MVEGWYHTGDAVTQVDNGGFVFVDRMNDTIRRFGENISSVAVENSVMLDQEVLECAVLGVDSPEAGQEILLVVVPSVGGEIDPEMLAVRLAERLPRYMQPSEIRVLSELPKTPNGKIRKSALLVELSAPPRS